MSERLDRFDPVEKRERFFDIDMSRTQQLLSERAVQRGKSMGQVVFLVIEKSSSGERHSVAVDAIAGYSDDNVTGLDVVTDQNFVERHVADGRTGQIEPVDHVPQLRSLSPGDRNPGRFRAPAKANGNIIQ